MENNLDERAVAVTKGVENQARKCFYNGNFVNPYGDPKTLIDLLTKGMAYIFQAEMDSLIQSKTCPCCGQFTMGDIDW